MNGGSHGGDLAAVVLAAGEGRRLRPLTRLRPKPLCPLGDATLLDHALARVAAVVPVSPGRVAVNAHHLADQVVAAVGGRAHVSVEHPEPLGTAGAIGALSGWLDGRDVLIGNGDAVLLPQPSLEDFVDGWDRTRPRLLVVDDPDHADFDGRWRFAGLSLLAAALAARLPAHPAGLYETVWRHNDIDLVACASTFVDCADPASYLAANLLVSGGASVIGAGAVVEGTVRRCVVWPGARVHLGEVLVDCVRALDTDGSDLTVGC